MIKIIFHILLLQVYFSQARLQDNAGSSHPPENRVNKFLDCNARSSPDVKQEPLNSGALVLQREDQGQLNAQDKPVLEPRTKRPYVYDHDAVDNPENRKMLDIKTSKKLNIQNPETVAANENSLTIEKPAAQKELKDNNLSDPTLLGKLVEKCLTKRLLIAQKANRLNSEDLLNNRRSNSYDSVEEDATLEDTLNRNDDGELVDPTEAEGLRRLNHLEKNVPLINHKRVCYACTSASSPNCWVPNRLTTVKYCLNGHDSCTTKTYQAGSELVVVRDCGKTCASAVGYDPEFKSCTTCHSDFCNTNGADTVTSHGFILFLFVISVIKAVI